jgi:hypothetical protein
MIYQRDKIVGADERMTGRPDATRGQVVDGEVIDLLDERA